MFPVISMFDPAVKVFCFSATELASVTAKFASSPIAFANSLSVLRRSGAESTIAATALAAASSA